ncbi:MoaD/ThiS family protein [Geopsychrobacter electrodiphilus]|uniref:MoaD/ThiS family protein n=1 Tax=Geopsychrobacter electrodiphilus TaxID=225196 RepID=UPI000362A38F|nr:MoaD/ThiS family protein [Geopsychrobacter electrodiphilus]
MRITIKLIASLGGDRSSEQVRTYPSGTRICQVIEELALPEGHFGMAVLNGCYADLETVLSPGDVLSLLPQVGGG